MPDTNTPPAARTWRLYFECTDDPMRDSRDSGFVLIAVLAALGLLAMVALLLTKTVSLDTKIAAFAAQQARDEALADGLTRLAVQHLAVNQPAAGKSGLFRLDGIPLFCRLNDHVASIAFFDTDGLINLNLASQALLNRVFAGVGMQPDSATQLAQAVIDFRSTGDAALAGGSKLAAYQLAGLPHGPKAEAFATVGELDQVLGMTPALLARLRPLMTVHSRFGVVDPRVAGLPVLLALAGDSRPTSTTPDPQTLDALRSTLDLPAAFTYIARTRSTSSTKSEKYVVRAIVYRGRIARFVRQATVGAATNSQSGASLKEWTALDPGLYDFEGLDLAATPACLGGVLWIDP